MTQIKSRPKRLSEAGRAKTVCTSLSASQYAWLVSQGPSVAHTLREMVRLAQQATTGGDLAPVVGVEVLAVPVERPWRR